MHRVARPTPRAGAGARTSAPGTAVDSSTLAASSVTFDTGEAGGWLDADGEGPRHADRSAAAVQFRYRHALMGVAFSLAAAVQISVYAWIGDTAARSSMLVMAAAAAIGNLGVLAVARIAVRSRHHEWFFATWSVGTTALVLAGAAVDGGGESPLVTSLFLVLVYAAVAYRPTLVLILGFLQVCGFLIVGMLDASASGGYSTFFAITLGLVALMATKSALNREEQGHDLDRLTQQLELQAMHDSLTGSLNRRGFNAAIEQEMSRAARYHRPLSLLIVDVDRLKEINDRWGHAGGDQALRAVAATLSDISRRIDRVARTGGDEFALLVPEATMPDALDVAARLHAALRASTHGIPVTVSVGVASNIEGVDAADDLIKAADQALYTAKSAGRDCTAPAPDGMTAGAPTTAGSVIGYVEIPVAAPSRRLV